MRDANYRRLVKHGTIRWNEWRYKKRERLDLFDAFLEGKDLANIHLDGARIADSDLSKANLTGAFFADADIETTNMRGADLTKANLDAVTITDSDFFEANLTDATMVLAHIFSSNFSNAKLIGTDLTLTMLDGVDLRGTDFSGAMIQGTVFLGVDLSGVVGLEDCEHGGPSALDQLTLQKSGNLPLSFLRGVGFSDALIEYLPSLLNRAIQNYSCFISYSTKDQEFAERLHSDLQSKGIRCWFAPHDMPIGSKIRDEIDASIRIHDKLLLILSENSIRSDWVEEEVTKALEEEHKRMQTVLFPIRLDDEVMETKEAWAATLRSRNIGDFIHWKDHDAYGRSFEKMLKALSIK
jgi:hypothetical protein